MPTTPAAFESPDFEEQVPAHGPVDARAEDTFWARAHRRERYYSSRLDYEDYAPAYCVGYIGFAQYGGRFEDAERSLCANWECIKGDSRLTVGEALLAMRAAWDRMALQAQPRATWSPDLVGLIRRYLGNMPFNLGARLTR